MGEEGEIAAMDVFELQKTELLKCIHVALTTCMNSEGVHTHIIEIQLLAMPTFECDRAMPTKSYVRDIRYQNGLLSLLANGVHR